MQPDKSHTTLWTSGLVSLALLCVSAAAAQPDLSPIDAFVRTEMNRQKIPGVALAVVRGGTPIKVQGYGLANVEHRVAVTPDTIFQSGSVGKQFTAAGIMLLVEDGRLALDDRLRKFLPDAPEHFTPITVRHLLTHTSGLPDYVAGTLDYRRDYTEDELLQFAYGLKLEFAPGARWNYSNTGYVLLGILMHKVAGQFYGDLLRERLFIPAGMKTTRIITEEDIVPNRSGGYRLVDGELKHHEWVAPTLNTTADGSLYLSLRDMIAWDAVVRSRRILTAASWEQIFSPVSLTSGRPYPYGFGWQVDTLAGRRVVRHGGSWQGFKTHIARYPDDDLTIIVLANLAQANPERLSEGVAALLDPSLKPPALGPIAGLDRALETRVRRLLADAAAGALSPAEFAYVRAGFFPNAAKAYQEMLRKAGEIRTVTLLENRALGDDRIYTLDVAFASRTLRVVLGIAPDGKLAGFSLTPSPRD